MEISLIGDKITSKGFSIGVWCFKNWGLGILNGGLGGNKYGQNIKYFLFELGCFKYALHECKWLCLNVYP